MSARGAEAAGAPEAAVLRASEAKKLLDAGVFGQRRGDALFIEEPAGARAGGAGLDVMDAFDVAARLEHGLLAPSARLVRVW